MSMSPEPRASGPSAAQTASAVAHLDSVAEQANRTIDTEVQALIDAFKSILTLAAVRDKDAYTAAQGALEAEARAHVMVRAAQSLTLLSHALKLSLLLSLEPVDSKSSEGDGGRTTLNEEALELIARARDERAECLRLLQACGVGALPVDAPTSAAAAAPDGPGEPRQEQAQAQHVHSVTPRDPPAPGFSSMEDSAAAADVPAAASETAQESSAVPELGEEDDEEMDEVPVGT